MRAGLTVGTALAILGVTGHVALVPYATFGAFAVVYGGRAPVRGRWRVQARAGAWLVLAVATGCAVATNDARAWLAVGVAAVWAALGARLSDRYRWLPPGPMFLVFSFVTCAAIPVGPATIGWGALTAAVTATYGVLIGVAEGWIADRRGTRPAGLPPRGPNHRPNRRRVQAIRCAVAVVIAGGAATALGIERPGWAMIAAVVPLSVVEVHHQLARGVHRVLGTLVGLVLAGVLLALQPSVAVTLALVVVLQMLTELLVARHYGAALVFITPLALLVLQVSAPEPVAQLLLARGVETVIGIAVGVVIAVLTRRPPHDAPDPDDP